MGHILFDSAVAPSSGSSVVLQLLTETPTSPSCSTVGHMSFLKWSKQNILTPVVQTNYKLVVNFVVAVSFTVITCYI